jgi:putative ABC transport system permease protein
MKAIIHNFLFVLKRFKTSSILNIIGLSAAFAVFIVVLIQANYDLNYDRNFKNADNIYYLSISNPNGDTGGTMPTTMGKEISDKFPEVKHYSLICNYTPDDMLVDVINGKGRKQTLTSKVTPVTAGFLDVFTPQIISGSTQGLFSGQGKGLITASQAKKLFGNENPIGKTVYYHFSKSFYNNQKCNFVTIIAVCRDFPKNCSMANGIYTWLPDDKKESYNYHGYFVVDKQNISKLLTGLNSEKFFGKEAWQEMQKSEKKMTISLTPLHQAYFDFEKGRLTTILSLLAIGILTLIIAYINFLNFSIAVSPARVKALNMHKIIGANPIKLKLMLASEAVLFSLVAFALALLYIVLLKNTFIGEYFSADMALSANWPLLILIGVAAMVFGLLFGWYPAHYIVSFQPAVALRGSFAMSAKSNRLRNILIALQFTAAVVLIIVSLFIQIQNSFMQHRSWGIQKENIVYVPYGQLKIDMHTFGEELKKDPRIVDYTAAGFLPGHVGMSWGREFEGKQVSAYIWPVEVNFLHFFGVKMSTGRDFRDADSTGNKRAVIFNDIFLKTHQLNNDILGKDFPGFDKMLPIVGIAKNINYSSLRDSIRPMGFAILEKSELEWFFIKLSGSDIPGAVEAIRKTWEKYSDENFDLKFVDKTMDKLYKNETNLAKLISLFGLVTIIIAVMGVYGLIVFNTRYRAKEIAIRKVNGAHISEIVLMLNRNVLILLSIAYVVGVPIAYYIVHRWLQQFAYKTPIYWWVFAIAGLLIVAVTVVTISLHSYKAAATNPVDAVTGE